ncbi:endonuclease/Exonuclease/phosphatase family protein, partial [Vibrio parahaemolyticus V-223/04]
FLRCSRVFKPRQ